MASRTPLTIVDGIVQQLADGDELTVNPVDITLTYSGDQLDTVSTTAGTKTFSYSSGQLSSISDTETGKVSTFNYTAGRLTSVTVTDI